MHVGRAELSRLFYTICSSIGEVFNADQTVRLNKFIKLKNVQLRSNMEYI